MEVINLLHFGNRSELRQWLKDDKETVYDPKCDDIIRVAFMHQFHRAKLAELVKMLSGRDFDTREFKEDILFLPYFREMIEENNISPMYLDFEQIKKSTDDGQGNRHPEIFLGLQWHGII